MTQNITKYIKQKFLLTASEAQPSAKTQTSSAANLNNGFIYNILLCKIYNTLICYFKLCYVQPNGA